MSRMKGNCQSGLTLVELVIVIVTLGIIAAVAIPRFGSFSREARINSTKEEMIRIKKAIVGDDRLVSGGEYVARGFEGDVGFCPTNLVDLVHKPDSVPSYDKFTRIGWHGPYIDSAEQKYLNDAWGNPYVYDPTAREIVCTSITPNIELNF